MAWRAHATGNPIGITGDWTASELRRLAASSKHANQSRRLLSLAAVLDGMKRTEAAKIGGRDRQTLRDWVHRFAVNFLAAVCIAATVSYWIWVRALIVWSRDEVARVDLEG
jgi:hypothetical protein